MEHFSVLSHLKYVVVHCSTNNISKDGLSEVADSISCITDLLKKRNHCLKIIIIRIFSKDDKFSCFRIIVPQINQLLEDFNSTYDFIAFLDWTKDLSKANGDRIICYSGLIIYIFWNLEVKNLHYQFLHCYNSTNIYQHIQNLFQFVVLFSGLLFYLNVLSEVDSLD